MSSLSTSSTFSTMVDLRQASTGSEHFSVLYRRSLCNHLPVNQHVSCELAMLFLVPNLTGRSSLLHQLLALLPSFKFRGGSGLDTAGCVTPIDQQSYQTATLADLVLKMVAKGSHRIQHGSLAPELSSNLLYSHYSVESPSSPTTIAPPTAVHNLHCFVSGKRKIGFPLLGSSNSGPSFSFLWPNFNFGGPLSSSPRPRSIPNLISLTNNLHFYLSIRDSRSICSSPSLHHVLIRLPASSNQTESPNSPRFPTWPRFLCNLISEPCILFARYSSLKGRGHRSYLMSTSLVWLGNISFQSLVHSDRRVAWSGNLRIWFVGVFNISSNISSTFLSLYTFSFDRVLGLKKRDFLLISSIKERSFPSSSSLEERILSPLSLSRRGELVPGSRPENHSNALTVLFSSVMAHAVPVETTGIICLRTEVMVSSKSFGLMTSSRLVDEFVLKLGSFTLFVLEIFNSSPNDLSNFLKFVSLPLAYVCFNAFAVWLAYRACPIRLHYHVFFY